MSRFTVSRLAISRFIVRLAVGAICGSWVGTAPAAEQETAARPLPSASQSKIIAALDQPTEFDFRELPLADVVNHAKRKHQIEIVLDRKALNDEGLGVDTPVTENLKNLSLRSALRLMLGQLDLTYVTRDGYLLITSESEAKAKLSSKVYPVEDLVTLDSAFRPVRLQRNERDDSPVLDEVFSASSGFGGLGGRSRTNEAGDFSGLIDMITTTVAPTTWDEVGGPGTITKNANSLAIGVSQTDEVHEEIAALFAALRRVRDEQVAAGTPVESAESPETPDEKKPLKVRAYRLMRGTRGPGKSGFRPPEQFVGDSSPPPDRKARAKKHEGHEASGAPSDPAKEAPSTKNDDSAKQSQSAEDAVATKSPGAKDAVPGNESAPAKEGAPAAGANEQGAPAKLADRKLESLAQTIAKLVPEMIEPESWEPSGEGLIRAVGEGVVVRNTEEVQRRVARLMAELLPDCVPLGLNGPWGPWKAALERHHGEVRLSVTVTGTWPQEAEPRGCGTEARIHEALLEKCDLEFNELPLIEALRRLAEPRQVPLYIDRQAFSEEGVATDTPVTCSVKGVSCKTALQLLLDERNLAYVIRHEVLFVTTKAEAESLLITRAYPVFDLVTAPPDSPASRRALDFTSLIDNITTTIAPTTWDDVGGPGTIQSFTNSGALVISQTTEIHEEIAEYLRALREVGTAQTAGH